MHSAAVVNFGIIALKVSAPAKGSRQERGHAGGCCFFNVVLEVIGHLGDGCNLRNTKKSDPVWALNRIV